MNIRKFCICKLDDYNGKESFNEKRINFTGSWCDTFKLFELLDKVHACIVI